MLMARFTAHLIGRVPHQKSNKICLGCSRALSTGSSKTYNWKNYV